MDWVFRDYLIKEMKEKEMKEKEMSGCHDTNNNCFCSKHEITPHYQAKAIIELERRLDEHTKVLCEKRLAPFKCPVCEGSGYKSTVSFDKCHPCEGCGIVWG